MSNATSIATKYDQASRRQSFSNGNGIFSGRIGGIPISVIPQPMFVPFGYPRQTVSKHLSLFQASEENSWAHHSCMDLVEIPAANRALSYGRYLGPMEYCVEFSRVVEQMWGVW